VAFPETGKMTGKKKDVESSDLAKIQEIVSNTKLKKKEFRQSGGDENNVWKKGKRGKNSLWEDMSDGKAKGVGGGLPQWKVT